MIQITIKNIDYINGDYVLKNCPIFCRKMKGIRDIIRKKNLNNTDYIYARLNLNIWCESDGKSCRFDKLFLNKNYLLQIPEFINIINQPNLINQPNPTNEPNLINQPNLINEPIIANQYDVINELNQIEQTNKIVDEDGIEQAPHIIELDDNEKITDDFNNILDIETRGTREHDKIFFKMKDIANMLNMNYLNDTLLSAQSNYKYNIDYKYFICVYVNNGITKTKKELFLTFLGLIRVIFVSKNNNTRKYMDWIIKVIFTTQMGTDEQKNKLISDIKGVSYETVHDLFSLSANIVSCLYLVHLNTVQHLKTIMNINDSFPNDSIVCKCGFTKDFIDRKNGHKTEFKKIIDHITFKLLIYSIIDPLLLSQAETQLKNFLLPYKFEWDHKDELYIIPKNQINSIKQYFKSIGLLYSGNTSQHKTDVDDLHKQILTIESERDSQINKLNFQIQQRDFQIESQAKLFNEQLLQKNLQIEYQTKLFNEQLEKKDLEIENLKLKWQLDKLTYHFNNT